MKQMVVRLQLKHELFHLVHHRTIYSFTRSTIFTALFATETWKISLGPRSYLVLHISWVPTKTFALKTIVKLVKALYSHYKDRDQKNSLIPEMLCGPGLYFGDISESQKSIQCNELQKNTLKIGAKFVCFKSNILPLTGDTITPFI